MCIKIAVHNGLRYRTVVNTYVQNNSNEFYIFYAFSIFFLIVLSILLIYLIYLSILLIFGVMQQQQKRREISNIRQRQAGTIEGLRSNSNGGRTKIDSQEVFGKTVLLNVVGGIGIIHCELLPNGQTNNSEKKSMANALRGVTMFSRGL